MSEWRVAYCDQYKEDRQDAAFYIDDPTAQWVGAVSRADGKGEFVEIWRVGDMRVYLPESEYLSRRTDDLVEYGITDDATLSRTELSWENNPWFELYYRGEWVGIVEHGVGEAVESAKLLITDAIKIHS